MIQQAQKQPLQKDDSMKQQTQNLCQPSSSSDSNSQRIEKDYEVRESSRSVKFITFLITLFIGAICVFAIELYTQDQSQNAILDSSVKTKMKELTNNENYDPEHKISTMDQKYAELQRKVQNLSPLAQGSQKLNLNGGQLTNNNDNDQIRQILKVMKQLKQQIEIAHKNLEDEAQQNKMEIKNLQTKIQKNANVQNIEHVENVRAQTQQKHEKTIMLKDGKYAFKPPKILWLYEQHPRNYLLQLILKNLRYFAKASQYEVITVNAENFKSYISAKLGENADKVIDTLRHRLKSGNSGNLGNHIEEIIKQVILLSVLSENGGVITSGAFAMTEDLSWLENISNNMYANRGNKGSKPQVVGFYSPYYSSQPNKENIKPFSGMSETDKFLTIFPAMQNYFIAAEQNSTLITQVIEKVSSLLLYPHKFRLQMKNYVLNNLHGEDIYYEYFLIAVQVVLQDKQKQLDLKTKDTYRHFAVDYFGLYLINCLYAPYKLKNFYSDHKPYKIFDSLTQYSIQQFYENVGPLRYIAKITPQGQINGYLQDTIKGRRKPIIKGSFFQRLFFPIQRENFIVESTQKPFKNATGEPWTTLPKIIWVFWDKGLLNSKISNQLCVQNLRRMGKQSGFQVIEVNLSNVDKYLDATTLKKIDYSLKNAKMLTYPQSQGDLYRLALVAKHGGVYMDASYLALSNFDWLVNISQYPSQYIFNRFGDLPKVFMLWHPHYGSPFQWTINKRYNTKTHWHISYENNFIAAQKDSELIKDWFQLLLSLYLKSFDEVIKIFQECKIIDYRWIQFDWHYLLAMDAVKCVLGQRQLVLKNESRWEGASHYYRIWSMSGYLGQQKLRSNTNFQKMGSNDNLFVYRYSQQYVEGIIGKIRHVTKFYSFHNEELSNFITRHKNGNFTGDAHPESVFMRYMWNQKYSIEEANSNFRLKVNP